MNSQISAISIYLPERVLSNDELHEKFPAVRIQELTRLTGVNSRHIAASDETAVDMAAKASRQLFGEHDIDAGQIDFVLLNTQWPDYITPTSACILQDRLGIPRSTGALDISQGCTGFIYGLATAKGLIQSGSAKNVLLVTSETITRSIHPQDVSNMAIFGDAAVAALVTASESGEGIGLFTFGTDGSGYKDIIIKYGGGKYPLTKYTPEDYTDDKGAVRNDASFYMNGPAIFSFSTKAAPQIIADTLIKNKLEPGDIDFYIFHQANRIILETIIKKNNIPEEKTIIYLEDVGNTVSSTIPIALQKAMLDGKVRKGDRVLLAAFGVGLSWGGTIVQI
jgi:3-oxoacyl-[acyl-carrier-protein] synthase-3